MSDVENTCCQAPLYLPASEITRPDADFRNCCRHCHQKFDIENVPPFTHFACPHCRADLVVPMLFGDYWLLGRIPAAGTSEIYSALDPMLDREVVIKLAPVFRRDPDRTALCRKRLYYDAQVQTQLEHPNSVEIYRCGNLDDRDFKMMEKFTGGNVVFSPDPAVRTDPVLILSALSETVSLLEIAAEFRVPHGSISPKHMIFNDEGVLKLLNFRPVDEAILPAPHGEFIYFAPERLLNYDQSPAGDVYSLGVILFRLLTDRHPFAPVENLTEIDLVNKQQRNPAPHMKGLCEFHDDTLFSMITAMLSPHPEDRPTFAELAKGFAAAAEKLARKRNLRLAVSRLAQRIRQNLTDATS